MKDRLFDLVDKINALGLVTVRLYTSFYDDNWTDELDYFHIVTESPFIFKTHHYRIAHNRLKQIYAELLSESEK